MKNILSQNTFVILMNEMIFDKHFYNMLIHFFISYPTSTTLLRLSDKEIYCLLTTFGFFFHKYNCSINYPLIKQINEYDREFMNNINLLKESYNNNKYEEKSFVESVHSMYNIFENCKIIYDNDNDSISDKYKKIKSKYREMVFYIHEDCWCIIDVIMSKLLLQSSIFSFAKLFLQNYSINIFYKYQSTFYKNIEKILNIIGKVFYKNINTHEDNYNKYISNFMTYNNKHSNNIYLTKKHLTKHILCFIHFSLYVYINDVNTNTSTIIDIMSKKEYQLLPLYILKSVAYLVMFINDNDNDKKTLYKDDSLNNKITNILNIKL